MWKVLGLIVLFILSIVPGAICGAVVGAIYAPAKLWEFVGGGADESPGYDDAI